MATPSTSNIGSALQVSAPQPYRRAKLPTVIALAIAHSDSSTRSSMRTTWWMSSRSDALVEVTCSDAGSFHEFAVKDNGPGIAPEYHARIWDLFQTLESRDKVEGTGIGLSVVKKIVQSRGGNVRVKSQPGAGATFFVCWPKRPKEDAAPAHADEAPEPELRG